MDGLKLGARVHFVSEDGEHLQSVVVLIWNEDIGRCNLRVYRNDYNPAEHTSPHYLARLRDYDERALRPGTWHFIETALVPVKHICNPEPAYFEMKRELFSFPGCLQCEARRRAEMIKEEVGSVFRWMRVAFLEVQQSPHVCGEK